MIKMGFIGDMNGELAADLGRHIGIVTFAGSAAALDGVIVDGQGAAASAWGVDDVKSVLDAGRTLVLVRPTEPQLSAVRQVTGHTPSGDVALVTYTRSDRGSARYRSTYIPGGSRVVRAFSPDGALEERTETASPSDLGPHIVQAAQADDAPTFIAGDAGLQPPPGATWAYFNYSTPCNTTLNGPTINGQPDDVTAESGKQQLTGSINTEIFLYYANGNAPATPPYYVVLTRQSGNMSAGQVNSQLASTANSGGWLQYLVSMAPQECLGYNNQAYPQSTSAGASSVQIASDSQFVLTLSLTIPLIAETQNGTGPVNFNAVQQAVTTLPGWYVTAAPVNTSVNGVQTQWNYYQLTPFNALSSPPQLGQWMHGLFDPTKNNELMAFPIPSVAGNGVPIDVIGAWNVPTESIPDLWIRNSVTQYAIFTHNPSGCVTHAWHYWTVGSGFSLLFHINFLSVTWFNGPPS